ncbi:MAG: ribosomal protein S18-alanine N-acetyltransferase [Deltaproteobacteria bacterium]|nr:ribosomal protein S18-alanine N-acetyltransferase [Deltaproteobacteria bacterium]MBT4526817.1 ribosomal protein S18-alanine N-acetyltransferase [Deltaproteobacteria bacterium]
MNCFEVLSKDSFHIYEKEISQLDLDCFPTSGWDLDQWLTLFQNYQLKVLLALRDEKVLGFVAFSNIENESELLKIGVKQAERKLSLGSQLIKKMIDLLHNQNTDKVFLEVRSDNQNAIKLYSKYQFKLINRRKNYYQNPLCDALIYRLEM